MTKTFELLLVLLILAGCSKSNSVNPATNDPEFARPFSSSSIWNRKIPSDAAYVEVQQAIWDDSSQTPAILVPDLVTICCVDPSQPAVNFRLNQGWNYPERSQPRGEVLFQRKLPPDCGSEVRYPRNGNALYAIIDTAAGLADEGVGAWREPGGDFLTFYDSKSLHNIDVVDGNGLSGARGSGLSALGGAIRWQELSTGIEHALAVALSSRRYSKDRHYVWPASRGDGFAAHPTHGYLGNNPDYTMGTLLAIPHDINIDSEAWKTPQGRIVARAAQIYGMYIIDSGTGEWGGHAIAIGIERRAAYEDLGLTIDPVTDEKDIDPKKIDIAGFTSDIQHILRLVQAVKNSM